MSSKSPKNLYRDFSKTPYNKSISNKCKGGVKLPFPQKLYSLLSLNPDPSIISWQPHGRSFVVHQPEKFIQKIMPAHFKTQTKMTSFLRQLNLYGFTRILKGRDKGGYYHEMFLKGRKDLCAAIPRLRIKGQRKIFNAEFEPNFYKMTWVGVGHEHERDDIVDDPLPAKKASGNKKHSKKQSKKKKQPVVSFQQKQLEEPPIPFSVDMQQTTLIHSNMSVITDASDLDVMEYMLPVPVTTSVSKSSTSTTTKNTRPRTFSKEEMDEKKLLDPYDDACGGDTIHDACGINHTESEDVDLLWEALVDQRVYPLSWTGQEEVDFMHVFDD